MQYDIEKSMFKEKKIIYENFEEILAVDLHLKKIAA